jgi:hypothetical protein
MMAAEFNADGHLDLSLPIYGGGVLVHLNNGDGTFGTGTGYDFPDFTYQQVVGDFDADGRPDVISPSIVENYILMLLRNESCPACPADLNKDGTLSILDFIAFQQAFVNAHPSADCNKSGALNILDFVCFQSTFVDGCD